MARNIFLLATAAACLLAASVMVDAFTFQNQQLTSLPRTQNQVPARSLALLNSHRQLHDDGVDKKPTPPLAGGTAAMAALAALTTPTAALAADGSDGDPALFFGGLGAVVALFYFSARFIAMEDNKEDAQAEEAERKRQAAEEAKKNGAAGARAFVGLLLAGGLALVLQNSPAPAEIPVVPDPIPDPVVILATSNPPGSSDPALFFGGLGTVVGLFYFSARFIAMDDNKEDAEAERKRLAAEKAKEDKAAGGRAFIGLLLAAGLALVLQNANPPDTIPDPPKPQPDPFIIPVPKPPTPAPTPPPTPPTPPLPVPKPDNPTDGEVTSSQDPKNAIGFGLLLALLAFFAKQQNDDPPAPPTDDSAAAAAEAERKRKEKEKKDWEFRIKRTEGRRREDVLDLVQALLFPWLGFFVSRTSDYDDRKPLTKFLQAWLFPWGGYTFRGLGIFFPRKCTEMEFDESCDDDETKNIEDEKDRFGNVPDFD